MTNAIAIAAWALSAILVSELFGYPLHRLLHSGFIHFLSKNHMQHHLLLYGPLQKQRPREGHFEAPNLLRYSSGEGTPLVTEQFTLQESQGNSRAI
jgi:hypothetical protein